LRHEDIAAAEREVSIVARENANGARAKSGGRTVPVGGELIRLYADYLHGEYGGADSDYVFINLWAGPRGQAWSYPAAYDLVLRLRAKTGIAFEPHWSGTRRPPGGCATVCLSKSSPSSWDTHR
jgi:integrase/recombinase XerD